METTHEIHERNVLWGLGLSILTFGIYSLYWTYKLHTETNEITGFRHEPPAGRVILFGIITLGLYLIYWSWRQGVKFRNEAERRGSSEAKDCPSLYAILQALTYFVGITWPITLALMQDRLNQILRMRGLGDRPYDPERFHHVAEREIARQYQARAEAYEDEALEDEELQDALATADGRRALYLNTGEDAGDPEGSEDAGAKGSE